MKEIYFNKRKTLCVCYNSVIRQTVSDFCGAATKKGFAANSHQSEVGKLF